MDANQILTFVVRPTLHHLDPEIPISRAAERVVLLTAAHESSGFRYIDQLSNDPARPGPAYGLWQMEAATLADHWAWLRARDGDGHLVRPALLAKIEELLAPWPTLPLQLHGNLYLACAMARVHYRRAPEPLPDDLDGVAHLWKVRYNTVDGKGTEAEFKANARRAGWPFDAVEAT